MINGAYGPHLPVMANRVVELLLTDRNGNYLDATAGGGGHLQLLLDKLYGDAKVFAIDRDLDSIAELEHRFSNDSRVQCIHSNYGMIEYLPHLLEAAPFAGILMDLGVSSHQIEGSAERGFSYRQDGPLDMRMDQSQQITAYKVINDYSEKQLQTVFIEYGEEPRSRKIANLIVVNRPFDTTLELTNLIKSHIPQREHIKTLSRIFQAVRIEVNDELGALRKGLEAATNLLESGGRLVVMSYHSLEDRIVKQFFKRMIRECICPPKQPVCMCGGNRATLRLLFRGAEKADARELVDNPRSRSVRVRAVEKVKSYVGSKGERDDI